MAFSCGSSEAEDPRVEKFLHDFVSIYCDGLAPCCAASALPFDAEGCAKVASTLQAPAEGPDFFPGAADECLADVSLWMTACGEGPGPESCRRVFSGSVPAGGACTGSEECQHSEQDYATCYEGTCRIVPPSETGQPCGKDAVTATEYFMCSGPALYCDISDYTCRSAAGLGSVCNPPQCAYGSICDPETKICVQNPKAGEPCSGGCALEAYCNASTKLCAPRTALGAACTQFDECAIGLCTSGKCQIDYGHCMPADYWTQ